MIEDWVDGHEPAMGVDVEIGGQEDCCDARHCFGRFEVDRLDRRMGDGGAHEDGMGSAEIEVLNVGTRPDEELRVLGS